MWRNYVYFHTIIRRRTVLNVIIGYDYTIWHASGSEPYVATEHKISIKTQNATSAEKLHICWCLYRVENGIFHFITRWHTRLCFHLVEHKKLLNMLRYNVTINYNFYVLHSRRKDYWFNNAKHTLLRYNCKFCGLYTCSVFKKYHWNVGYNIKI